LWYINGIQQASSSFSNCFAIAGDYVLKGIVTNSAGCVNTISYIVRAYTRPVADFLFTPDKPVEGEDEVNFSNFSSGAGRLSFSWYFASNVAISNEKNPAYMFNNKGVYPVALVVQNDIGCADTAVKIVNVNPSFTFFAPNAFTPNGDERNENFTPVTRGVRSYELRIYNRWGMLLFKSNDSAEGWNGRFSGEDCKQDVYVWKVNLTTLSGDIKQYSGVVTLLR
jgi:gliding motility-associated-like protein